MVAGGRRIESGRAKSITNLAEQEGVTDAYVCRLLPLTCLAPDIVEAILDGRQPKGLRLVEMLGNGPLDWDEQRVKWGFSAIGPHHDEPGSDRRCRPRLEEHFLPQRPDRIENPHSPFRLRNESGAG
jgi:hypothetical protein